MAGWSAGIAVMSTEMLRMAIRSKIEDRKGLSSNMKGRANVQPISMRLPTLWIVFGVWQFFIVYLAIRGSRLEAQQDSNDPWKANHKQDSKYRGDENKEVRMNIVISAHTK
jgi:hypothetical protein